jgi:hypothetical protein
MELTNEQMVFLADLRKGTCRADAALDAKHNWDITSGSSGALEQ